MSAVGAGGPETGSTLNAGPRVMAPADSRIKVQVLNATKTQKLATRATRYLRDRGFDVVEAGNAPEQLDSTIVLDRVGKAGMARLVARAFGVARIETRIDSSRFVDVTVLVGADWPSAPGSLDP